MSEPGLPDARERVIAAFVQQVAGVLGIVVRRDGDAAADLAADTLDLNARDGGDQKPELDQRGFIKRTTIIELEINMRLDDTSTPGAFNAEIARIRAAALSDRTLGGLLVGEMVGPLMVGRQHFNGLEEGPADINPYRVDGAERGGNANLEFALTWATPPDDPTRLIVLGEWD